MERHIDVRDNTLTVASLQHIFRPAAAHTLRLGREYRESRLPTIPSSGAEVSYDVTAFSGMWEWRLMDALTLTLAARQDELHLKRSGPIPAAQTSGPQVERRMIGSLTVTF